MDVALGKQTKIFDGQDEKNYSKNVSHCIAFYIDVGVKCIHQIMALGDVPSMCSVIWLRACIFRA